MRNVNKLFHSALFGLLVAGTSESIMAQTLMVPPDSSYLDFPKLSRVYVQRVARPGKVAYSLTQAELKKLIVTARYLVDQNSVLATNENLILASIAVLDSTRKVLELKYEAETERTKLFESAYESMKKTSNAFQNQLDQCAADLKTTRREISVVRRRSFLKGAGAGVLLFAVLSLTLGDR